MYYRNLNEIYNSIFPSFVYVHFTSLLSIFHNMHNCFIPSLLSCITNYAVSTYLCFQLQIAFQCFVFFFTPWKKYKNFFFKMWLLYGINAFFNIYLFPISIRFYCKTSNSIYKYKKQRKKSEMENVFLNLSPKWGCINSIKWNKMMMSIHSKVLWKNWEEIL